MIDRRDFLARLAAGAASGALAPRLLAGETEGAVPKLRFATGSVELKKHPIERACRVISALGFEAIDIWGPHRECPHLEDCITRLGPEGTRELLARHKLAFFACSAYNQPKRYLAYLRFLARAGGKIMIHGAKVRPAPKGELIPRMKQLFAKLRPEIELAEALGVYVAIENHSGSVLCSLDSFRAFVEHNPSRRVGIALAPYHLEATGVSVPAAIRAGGKQVLLYYAWQYDKPQTIIQLPGHGKTDFTPHLAALRAIGYRDYVNIFMHGQLPLDELKAALKKSMDYLRACNAKLARSTAK